MRREDLFALATQTIKCIERDSASQLTERQKTVIIHWLMRCMEDANNASVDKVSQHLDRLQQEIKFMQIRAY